MDEYYGTLIENVRNFKFLYNHRDPSFKDRTMRQNAWTTISLVCGGTAETAEKTWSSLRNRYCQEKRRYRLIPTGSEGSAAVQWKFFKMLSFLDAHIVPRRTYGNVSKLEETESCPSPVWRSQLDQELFEEPLTELRESPGNSRPESPILAESQSMDRDRPATALSPVPSPAGSGISRMSSGSSRTAAGPSISSARTEPGAAQPPKKRKKKDLEVEQKFEVACDTIAKALTSGEEEDEDILFAKSLAFSLKRMSSNKKKARCKLRLLEVLEEFEDE